MAHEDQDKAHWDDDDRFYSSHSDDSPILSYRYDKRRCVPYPTPSPPEERERRSALSLLGKVCLFSAAMILFCVLMYIPVYNGAKYHVPTRNVPGWPVHTNRDTRLYVYPNNITILHEPNGICHSDSVDSSKNKTLLLIIVCSSISNFKQRQVIRETWASYENYQKGLNIFTKVRDKYKNFESLKYDLLNISDSEINLTDTFTTTRVKRDISFKQLLPALAKALNNISVSSSKKVPEKRFEDDDDGIIPGFDMNRLNEVNEDDKEDDKFEDYDYPSNIMKIPQKDEDYEDDAETPNFNDVLNIVARLKDFDKIKESMTETSKGNREFKVVFLLGLSEEKNKTNQEKVEDEVKEYGDIIQEQFIDSYNNLTLKSIMMLKWINNKCNNVRYILKTDDDTYVNLPNLILNLKNRSLEFDKHASAQNNTEYLMIGHLLRNVHPISNSKNKWYMPKYMYGGRVYPPYLSGTGYVMSLPAARALYEAALTVNYMHLEDVFITGMCAVRAKPRLFPRNDASFSIVGSRHHCWAHDHATTHRMSADAMRNFQKQLTVESEVDRCERIRLKREQRERLHKQKFKKNKKTVGN